MSDKDKIASKSDIVDELLKTKKMSKAEASEGVDAVLKAMMHLTKTRKELRLIGFGTFKRLLRKATTGRNPKTGKVIDIAEKTMVKFSAGKNFKDLVQG